MTGVAMGMTHRAVAALLFAGGIAASIGCAAPPPTPPGPTFQPTATVRDIMDHVVAPNAATIWDAVQTSTTAAGVEHKMPKTDEEWLALEHAALTLSEVANLLIVPGRAVAPAGATADAPDVELNPAKIASLIERDRAAWGIAALRLHDTSVAVLASIRKKDVQGLFDGGAAVYTACESCHQTYWYPGAMKSVSSTP